jgi:hypothetical protein
VILRRVLTAIAVVSSSTFALFAIERSAADDDAAQYWVIAGRLAETGRPFYVAAVDHKGPLWAWVYRAGYAISGDQRYFWFVMAAGVMLFALLIGWAIHRIVVHATSDRLVGRVAALATVTFLWFGPDAFSKTLYGRNITVAFTALAVVAVVRALDDDSRRATAWLVPAGAALGLASSTVLTTLAPTVLIAGALAIAGSSRRRSVGRALLLLGSAAAALAAIAAWYVVRGVGGPFKTYFWDYNRIYASSNEPLIERAVIALGEMIRYHLSHPYLLAGPVCVVLVARLAGWPRSATWSRPTRVGVVLVAWWTGEAISVAAPGRWFEHYWILLVVPTAALTALVVAQLRSQPSPSGVLGPVPWRRATALGLVPAMLVVVLSVPGVTRGVEAAASFDGFTANEHERWADAPARIASMRAATAALTDRGEPVYAWTPVAGLYVAVDRPAASRFDRRNWQTGAVFASEATAVLPGVWDDLMADLAGSRPRLVIELLDEPIPADSPLAALLRTQYRPVFDIEPDYARFHLRQGTTGETDPPVELAARSEAATDDATTCLHVDGGSGGEVVLSGSATEIVVELQPDRVVTWAVGGDGSGPAPVMSQRGPGDLEIRAGAAWVVVWEGDRLVGAAGAVGGIADMTWGSGVTAAAVPCAR